MLQKPELFAHWTKILLRKCSTINFILTVWCFVFFFFFSGQIEGLLDDIDFKAKVSRQEFEDLCSDLFKRVPGPVQQALSSAQMNMVCLRKCITKPEASVCGAAATS